MKTILYKRNNKGDILSWSCEPDDIGIVLRYGLIGKKQHEEFISIAKKQVNEAESRIKAKRKEGYKALEDVYDNAPANIKDVETLKHYLDAYLPKYNTTEEGFVLPMLAKTLEDNTPFEKFGDMLGQSKINGVRCIVGLKKTEDLFSTIKVTFHSREGTDWTDLFPDLGELIYSRLTRELIELMIEEGACLDGELYLPRYQVNDINSFVKNTTLPQHLDLQYWCYDLCVENMSANERMHLLWHTCATPFIHIYDYEAHYSNKEKFVLLSTTTIADISQAVRSRDRFIAAGYEGLIIRNPQAEYAFGKRNQSMFKFKKKLDGRFEVLDIKEDKRGLPIYTLKNDINDELFECTINLPQYQQKRHLMPEYKGLIIGKQALVEYRERSGVKQVPFHAKIITIYV